MVSKRKLMKEIKEWENRHKEREKVTGRDIEKERKKQETK